MLLSFSFSVYPQRLFRKYGMCISSADDKVFIDWLLGYYSVCVVVVRLYTVLIIYG